MKVFVAGATGAIGRPLIKSLTLAGYTTFGMVRSQSSSAFLSDSGAESVIADALDTPSVSAAVVTLLGISAGVAGILTLVWVRSAR